MWQAFSTQRFLLRTRPNSWVKSHLLGTNRPLGKSKQPTMAAPTFIGVHWYNRPQTLGQCSFQLHSFLQKLQQHNAQVYGHWFEQANSKAKALTKPLVGDYTAVMKAFGTKARESDYPATSFGLSLWNGALNDEEGIVLRVSLGSSEKKLYPNSCTLDLYQNQDCQAFYTNSHHVQELEKLFSSFWQPEKLILQ